SVDTNPTPPTLRAPLTDVLALIRETARFSALVCAYPPPSFQWMSNGVTIPGATNHTLVIPDVGESMSGTIYCVRIANAYGSTNFCARLTVTPRPTLVVTEVMPSPSTNCLNSADWFELTNCGSNAVNLLGYRFATGNQKTPSLADARVVTQAAVLTPGQSAL